MKYLFLVLFLIGAFVVKGQYNPALNPPVTNRPLSIAQGVSTDSRSQFYDAVNAVWRDYQSKSEVMSYLNLTKYRQGHFPVFIHNGGTLNGSGVWVGGTTDIYVFKDSTDINSLIYWSTIQSVNGQTGVVITKNADSIKGRPVDTSARRNGYALVWDSTNRKWYLAPNGAGSYSAGQGIDITGQVISALNTSPLWNANQLRGRSITTSTPSVGQILYWDGTSIIWKDTTVTGAGGGTVTNVASGYGLLGGPITTIGTLRADTLTLSGIYLRRKDSTLYYTRYDADTSRTNIYNAIAALVGGGISQLTGDGAAGPGSGSQVLTLTTVNPNVGSFTNANITVNGKGLVTAASNGTAPVSNASGSGDTLVINNTIKRLNAGYGIINTPSSTNITQKVDTATLFPAVRTTISTPAWKNTVYVNDTTTSTLVFDTTLTPTIGNTVEKDWLIFDPLHKQVAPNAGVPFMFSSASTTYNTGRSNEVSYLGYNIKATGSRIVTGKAAIGIGIESHYEPFAGSDSLCEMHFAYTSPAGTIYRMGSYTVENGTGNIDFSHTVSTFGIKAPSTSSQYFTLSGTGSSGSGPTNMSFINNAGNFNVVQNTDKSVIFNNTYSATNRSLQISSSWDNVQLPGAFLEQTLSTFSTPILANSDIRIAGGTFSPTFAQIFKSPTLGMSITSGTGGSSYDFNISGRAGANVLLVPANTITASFVGKVGIRTETPAQALHVKGQVQIDTLTTGTAGSDSVVVSIGGLLKKIAQSDIAGAAQIITVIDIPTMQGYAGTAGYIYVQDSAVGGGFHLYTGPLSPDGSTIYSGVGGRKWQRDYVTNTLDFSITGTLASTDSILTYASGAFKHSPATVLPFLAAKNTFTDSLITTSGVRFTGLTAGVGTKALRINPANGQITYADTTTSGTAYTFSTGLTNASGTVTNNLSTGISGGQTLKGGTASSENLTITSTNHAVKGNTFFGTSLSVFNENTGRWGFGTTSPSAYVTIGAGAASAGSAPLKFTSATPTTTPEIGAVQFNNGLWIIDSSNSVRDTIASRSWARNNISGGAGTTYTFSTGLTNTSNTITNNLATGVSGGQTAIGSTSTNSGLTLKATTNTGATGADIILTSGTNGGTEIARGTNAGFFGVGTGSTVSARLHSISTTEPLRLGYDASNFATFVMSSGGNLTITPSGNTTTITNFLATGTSSANLFIANAQGTGTTTNAQMLFGGVSTINLRLGIRGSVASAPATTTNYVSFIVGQEAVTVPSTGTSTIFASAVFKPLSITTSAGTLTNSANAYFEDGATGATNNYNIWAAGTGNNRFDGKAGFGVTTPTASVHTAPSTTSAASLRIPSGTAPTSPNEGDLWNPSAATLVYATNSTTYKVDLAITISQTLDFGSTAAGAATDLTVTATGASVGDAVFLGVPNGSVPNNGTFFAWVSASNVVTVRFANNDATNAKDPASGSYIVKVIKF